MPEPSAPTPPPSHPPLLEGAKACFGSRGWAYREVPDAPVIVAEFEAYHCRLSVHAQSYDELGALSVVGTAPAPVPEDRRRDAAELLMRINTSLNVGALELDMDNGAALFRATNLFPSGEVDDGVCAGLVHTAIAEIDRLVPLLSELVKTPAGERPNLRALLAREDLIPDTEALGGGGEEGADEPENTNV